MAKRSGCGACLAGAADFERLARSSMASSEGLSSNVLICLYLRPSAVCLPWLLDSSSWFSLAHHLPNRIKHVTSHRMSQTKCQLENVNRMDAATFVSVFGAVYEHSPWVAEAAWPRRPFASLAALHAVMDEVVKGADQSRKLALIKAHPELAGRLARSGQLTPESRSEQTQAGLTSLPEHLTKRMLELNHRYQEKFGFPFIICARLNNVATILRTMEHRLNNSREMEFETALTEISKIARLRLTDIVV